MKQGGLDAGMSCYNKTLNHKKLFILATIHIQNVCVFMSAFIYGKWINKELKPYFIPFHTGSRRDLTTRNLFASRQYLHFYFPDVE